MLKKTCNGQPCFENQGWAAQIWEILPLISCREKVELGVFNKDQKPLVYMPSIFCGNYNTEAFGGKAHRWPCHWSGRPLPYSLQLLTTCSTAYLQPMAIYYPLTKPTCSIASCSLDGASCSLDGAGCSCLDGATCKYLTASIQVGKMIYDL